MLLPNVRTSETVEQIVGKELIIYDLRNNRILQLNETLKIVYEACGRLSFDELKRRFQLTDDLIHLALDELSANHLLENYDGGHFAGLSRREAIKKIGAASMIALPIIASIAVPTAANAASTCPAGRCVAFGEDFCSDCNQNRSYTRCNSNDGTCTDCTPNVSAVPSCASFSSVTNSQNFDYLRN